jgi:hypothetical protein
MNPLILTMVAIAVGGTPEPACFVPAEQTAGWKRVDVPDEAPALAAPAGVDQFRSGEPAWLLEQDLRGYLGATRQRGGITEYTFRVPAGTRRMNVQFVASLRGAEVDAWAYGAGRTFPLWDKRRVAETSVEVEWLLPEIDGVVVRVHHHLRPVPIVASWRTARWIDLAGDASIPAAFRVTRSLYFRHPGGQVVELCDFPSQPLSVERVRISGTPSGVSMRKK